jgi:hypothetical protein
MSTPAQSNAVLVAIRTPRVTVEELESSLQELTRLVNTLEYDKRGRESFLFAQSVDVNLSCNRVAYLTRADKHLSRASCPAVELL